MVLKKAAEKFGLIVVALPVPVVGASQLYSWVTVADLRVAL
jgi:hypothetical protein